VIRGAVDALHEPVVELTVTGGAEARSVRLPFIVDTGFTGGITLPAEIVDELELPNQGEGRAWLADGSMTQFSICEASVE
jgi:predicted aspartyl protease